MTLKSTFMRLVKKKSRFQSPLDFKELREDFIKAFRDNPELINNNSLYSVIEGFIDLYGHESEKHPENNFSVPCVGIVDKNTAEIKLFAIYYLLPKLLEYKNKKD